MVSAVSLAIALLVQVGSGSAPNVLPMPTISDAAGTIPNTIGRIPPVGLINPSAQSRLLLPTTDSNHPLGLAINPSISADKSYKKIQRQICGRIDRYTEHQRGCVLHPKSHQKADYRIYSSALNQPRDLYVYTPPGYNPCNAYPLILWLHGAFGDETAFLFGAELQTLEKMMADGTFPPAIIACPDGTIDGSNRFQSRHSFYINGKAGSFEDYVLQDVVPFVESHYSVRPEREARAIFGLSAGGLGAMSIAIRHRNQFSTVATLAAPVNLRCGNKSGNYFKNFDPNEYCWIESHESKRVIGKILGLIRFREGKFMEPIFGDDQEEFINNVKAVNPADLLFSTNLQPGELNIYLNFPGWDNFNFDAENESFIWLAQQRGICVKAEKVLFSQHLIHYFHSQVSECYKYIGQHLQQPVRRSPPIEHIMVPTQNNQIVTEPRVLQPH